MSKVSVMHKVAALLSILLMTAFSSSPLSASPLLPSVLLNGDTLAKTCFDNNCTQQELTNGNSSTTSPDSTAQTTTVTSKVTSISARSESDVLPAGGSAPASFTSIATGEASVSYFFEIVGPQNTSVEALVAGTGNIAVTGNFASTGYLDYLAEARLILPVAPVQDIFIEGGSGLIGPNQVQTMSNSFSIGGTFDFDTNTPYQVIMQVKTGTDLNEQSTTLALADLIATASIDPSFQLLPFFANDYSIVFSDGIGDAAATTPLPATLPLFAGGLGFLGYLTRRKRAARQALAVS